MKKHSLLIVMVLILTGLCACGSKNIDSPKAVTIGEDTVNDVEVSPSEEQNSEPIAEQTTESVDEQAEQNEEISDDAESEASDDESASNEIPGGYEEVPIFTVQASSQLDVDEDYNKYHPCNLCDHDRTTAYVEGEPDNGIGQMVEFEFGTGFETTTYSITRIEFCPGYQKSAEVFENNSRPTKLSFYFPNGEIKTADMGSSYDQDSIFTFDMDPVVANKCVMVIEDAVSGKKYKDCCISEVTFYAQPTDGMRFFTEDPNYEIHQGGVSADYIVSGYLGEELVWTYQTHNPLTELTESSYVTSGHDKVIVCNEQNIVALDANTGEELWISEDVGFPGACSFDSEGNLYVCGYYGSNVRVIDKDGKTIFDDNPAGDKYSWTSMMTIGEDKKVSIYYARYDDDDMSGRIFTKQF